MSREYVVQIHVTYVTTQTVYAEDWEEAYNIANQKYAEGDYDDAICEAVAFDVPYDTDIYVCN